MKQIHPELVHPLAVGQKVNAKRPQCPCKGAAFTEVTGTIGKVIHNQKGWWYYLSDVGITVKGEGVISIAK